MMTMSAIFLVHTISLLLLLQPTLHLADDERRGYAAKDLSNDAGGGGGGGKRGGSMEEHSYKNNNNNNTNLMSMRGIDSGHHHFGQLTMMTMTASTRLPPSAVAASVAAANLNVNVPRGHRHVGGAAAAAPSFHYLPLSSPSASSFPSSAQSQSSSSSSSSSSSRMSRRAAAALNNNNNRNSDKDNNNNNSNDQKGGEFDGGEPLEPLYLPSSTRIIGPYFETNRTRISVTARAGQMVLLDCPVVLLQGRTVSWLRRVNDNLELLTVGNTTYGTQSRFGLHFRYPNNWRLGILNVNKRDEGVYECQLSTHPVKALVFHLKVIAPAVFILDENGNAITERHYKVDSSLHLTCKASHLDKSLDHIGWFKGDRSLPGSDSRIKVKLWKNSTNGEASAFLSVLSVRKGDSGNYTCRASPLASNTIAVHVLNGELPAAVQHENSANVLLGSCFLQSACCFYYVYYYYYHAAVAAILILY